MKFKALIINIKKSKCVYPDSVHFIFVIFIKIFWPSGHIQRLIKLKLFHIHVDLIAGLPGEELKDIGHSFNKAYSLEAEHFQLGFLKVLKGTKIETQTNEHETIFLSKPPFTVIKNKWISFAKTAQKNWHIIC